MNDAKFGVAQQSASWLLWVEGKWLAVASVLLATLVISLAVRRVIHANTVTRTIVAVTAVVLMLALIVFVDLPGNESWREFMAARSVFSGVMTSLLILVAGLLAYDVDAEKHREKHAASLRHAAFSQLAEVWRRTQEKADMELYWKSPKEQSEDYYFYLRESHDSAGIWLTVLANLMDDDSLDCTRLVAGYRWALTPLLGRQQKPRELKDLVLQWSTAGLILEQLRYKCLEPASSEPQFFQYLRPDLWSRATHTHLPGLYAAGKEPPITVFPDGEVGLRAGDDTLNLFSDTHATQAEKRGIVSRHGTFREGADMWRIAELLAKRNFERTPIAPPTGFDNYLDYLADFDKNDKGLLEARKKHVAMLPRRQERSWDVQGVAVARVAWTRGEGWRSLRVHVHPIQTVKAITTQHRSTTQEADEPAEDDSRN